jgi:hypothetical protein
MNKFVKKIKLDVIATNEYQEQEFFTLKFLTEEVLSSEKNLLDYVLKQLKDKTDLMKLSLCWTCSEEIVNKYKTIQDSIEKNAKYYFEKGALVN